jgi:hypothetical protein
MNERLLYTTLKYLNIANSTTSDADENIKNYTNVFLFKDIACKKAGLVKSYVSDQNKNNIFLKILSLPTSIIPEKRKREVSVYSLIILGY